MKPADVALRHLVECLDSYRVPLNRKQRQDIPGDVPYWGSGGIAGYISKTMFDEVLVLLGEDGAPFFDPMRDVSFCVSGPVWINNHIHVLRPRPGVDPRFLTYSLNSVDYARYITGSTRDKLTQDDMREIQLAMPPLEVQRRVADFLDDQVVHLKDLIQFRQRQLALVEESFERRMSELVECEATRIRLKFLLRQERDALIAGPFGSDLLAADMQGSDVRVFNQASVLNHDMQGMRPAVSHAKAHSLARFSVQPGDLLVTGRGSVGQAGIVPPDAPPGIIHPCLLRVRLDEKKLRAPYLALFLRHSRTARHSLRAASEGTTIEVVYSGTLRQLSVDVPVMQDQERVLDIAGEMTAEVSGKVALMSRSLTLLHERKQALITAAVTGEFDVSTAVGRVVA